MNGPWHATRCLKAVSGEGGSMDHRVISASERRMFDRVGGHSTSSLALLVDASAVLGATLDADEAVDSIQSLFLERGAEACTVCVDGPEGRTAKGLGDVVSSSDVRWLFDRVRRSGESVVVDGVDDRREPRRRPDGTDRIRRALVGRRLVVVPLSARGVIVGAMAVVLREAAVVEPSVVDEIGRRLGATVRSCHLYRDAVTSVDRRGDALASVAHDLRGPLSVVNLVLRDLLSLTHGREAARRSLELARHATDRMSGLLTDLLDLAKVEGEGPVLRLSACEPRALVADTVMLFEPLARRRSISLYDDVSPDLPMVHCDRDRVLRVLSNLVGNSIKYTPSGKHISVEASPLDDAVLFRVVDAGVGIAAADLSRIFDRFSSVNPREGGAGLGLAIAKAFVEAHGGRVWAESELGAGTTIAFTLPCDRTRTSDRAPSEPRTSDGAPSQSVNL